MRKLQEMVRDSFGLDRLPSVRETNEIIQYVNDLTDKHGPPYKYSRSAPVRLWRKLRDAKKKAPKSDRLLRPVFAV